MSPSREAAFKRHFYNAQRERVGRAFAMMGVSFGAVLIAVSLKEFDMAFHTTGIGPLRADVRLEDTSTVHALLVAFRWQDAEPDRIHSYLAKLAGGPPGQLRWVEPEQVVAIALG